MLFRLGDGSQLESLKYFLGFMPAGMTSIKKCLSYIIYMAQPLRIREAIITVNELPNLYSNDDELTQFGRATD